ncbi:MAG: hypothetical protein KatS3mg093_447 [Candidatus Parcubacteria bacterium]|nr:MAG: hypothetical protein KatS3mg093_447 [Candidatus Parcubacteria bacterium]
MFERFLAVLLLILLFPVFLILYILVKLDSSGSFLFRQLRAGKNRKPFLMFKIRTMVENAEELKQELLTKNEADGPVFKIRNDPRFTRVGRIISRIGIDELAQLINIAKGEMSFVGPRPLLLPEAAALPKEYNKRFKVKPGIFSSWVAEGAFHNDFDRWMKFDLQDVENKNLWYDLKIVVKSLRFWLKLIINLCLNSRRD